MGYSTPSLVPIGQLYDLIKKRPNFQKFLKFANREIRKFPYEQLTFFLDKLYQKVFLFYDLGTRWILHNEFDSI